MLQPTILYSGNLKQHHSIFIYVIALAPIGSFEDIRSGLGLKT